MLICDECGRAFHESLLEVERYPGTMFEPPEVLYFTPCCHTEEFSKAKFCPTCREYVADIDSEFEICPDCRKKGVKELEELTANASEAAKVVFKHCLYDI